MLNWTLNLSNVVKPALATTKRYSKINQNSQILATRNKKGDCSTMENLHMFSIGLARLLKNGIFHWGEGDSRAIFHFHLFINSH